MTNYIDKRVLLTFADGSVERGVVLACSADELTVKPMTGGAFTVKRGELAEIQLLDC